MLYGLSGVVSADRVMDLVKDMKEVVAEFGWADEVVHPWAGCPMKVGKIIDDISEYKNCTKGTRDYLVDMANGLVRILNAWMEHEKNGVWVKIIDSGKMAKVEKDFAEELVSMGRCEIL